MKKNVRILYSANPDALEKALSTYKYSATVEAEYGSKVVNGTCVTLAHHANGWQDCPAPCRFNYDGFKDIVEVIGISHIDLDTLGGIIKIIGHPIKIFETFWMAVEYIDVNGPHRMNEIKNNMIFPNDEKLQDLIYDALERYLCAYWAWNSKNRVNWKRDDQVYDVTEDVFEHIGILEKILANEDIELIFEGKQWKEEQEKFNSDSFVKNYGNVILRKSKTEFVNHLYNDPEGNIAKAVVGYKEEYGSITLSFERDFEGLSAVDIMTKRYGEKAGGHRNIAGSPRDQKYTLEDAIKLAEHVESLFEK